MQNVLLSLVFSTLPDGGLALLEARTPAVTLMVKYNPL